MSSYEALTNIIFVTLCFKKQPKEIMKITYISHACLLIETDTLKIVTDPWVMGAAYCKQWYLYPKATQPELIQDADYVLYSHGHEDHLHAESLQTIQKQATILYPYSWYGGTAAFFNELGFSNVKEVINETTVALDKHTRVTYLSNNLDTILVLEHKNTVLVNINDALPSASQKMIDHFITKIKSRWPNIDYVFSSYGGASYFPNAVHYEHKNDREIAEVRERFFVNNFCKIIAGLQPKIGVPFASDFVLLDDKQRWINEIKFQRSKIKDYYSNYTHNNSPSHIIEAYPGDYFEKTQFHQASPYHTIFAEKNFLAYAEEIYAEEIQSKRNFQCITESETAQLLEKVKQHIQDKAYIIPSEIRKHIRFAINIADASEKTYLDVNFRTGETLFDVRGNAALGIDLLIEIKSETLQYAIDNEWGGDAIIIGYGAEVHCYTEEAVSKEYENYCVRLLSRYPNTKEYLQRTPMRGIKYLLSDTIKRKNLFNKMLGNTAAVIDYSDPRLGNRNLWLNKSKCDVCKACNI